MRLILNNPYRIVGLLVGASAAIQRRHLTRLHRFIEAEKEPDEDFSFPILGKLCRTADIVNEAASKLNLDHDKISAALFWFYNGNPITDEPALDSLKERNPQNSIEIWMKLTGIGEVTSRNSSAFQNLSTLFLCKAFSSTIINSDLLERGISLKLKFLESDFVKDFKALATDSTYRINKKELQLLFLNQVQSEINNHGGISSNKFLELLNKQDFSAKEDFLKGFVQKPIEQIERKIEEAETKRKTDKAGAANVGNTLFEQTFERLVQIKSILGTSNIKYSSISDQVSIEILQCGIDFFSHYRDSNTDPGNTSMELFQKARTLATGSIAIQKCEENIENLQEWINDKPERDKQKLIGDDLQFIMSKLERFQNLPDTIANAKDLCETCKPKLDNIRNSLGRQDEFYLKISSAVVNNIQQMLVTVINKEQETLQFSLDPIQRTFGRNIGTNLRKDSYNAVLDLKGSLKKALILLNFLRDFDMVSELRSRYNRNYSELWKLANQFEVNFEMNSEANQDIITAPYSSGGCYVATMVYGDYNHPQVVILRTFRDNVLSQSVAGKQFIKIYYYYSPKLVKKLKDKKLVNRIIRNILNQVVKIIEK